jgi:hypothetical protein
MTTKPPPEFLEYWNSVHGEYAPKPSRDWRMSVEGRAWLAGYRAAIAAAVKVAKTHSCQAFDAEGCADEIAAEIEKLLKGE